MDLQLAQLQTSVLSVFQSREYQGWRIQARKNPFAALWFIVKGEIKVFIDEKNIMAREGSVLLFPPEVPFSAKMSSHCAYARIIVVRFSLYTLSSRYDWLRLYRLPVDVGAGLETSLRTDRLKRHFLAMFASFRRNSPFHIYQTNGLLHLLIGVLIESNVQQIRPIQNRLNRHVFEVFRVVQWMKQHLAKKSTLMDLAQLIPVSPDHLNKIFNSVIGMPTMHYLNYLRIQKAKEFLQKDDCTVHKAGSLVGIDDPHYFSRLFKKIEGMSPSEYRKSFRMI